MSATQDSSQRYVQTQGPPRAFTTPLISHGGILLLSDSYSRTVQPSTQICYSLTGVSSRATIAPARTPVSESRASSEISSLDRVEKGRASAVAESIATRFTRQTTYKTYDKADVQGGDISYAMDAKVIIIHPSGQRFVETVLLTPAIAQVLLSIIAYGPQMCPNEWFRIYHQRADKKVYSKKPGSEPRKVATSELIFEFDTIFAPCDAVDDVAISSYVLDEAGEWNFRVRKLENCAFGKLTSRHAYACVAYALTRFSCYCDWSIVGEPLKVTKQQSPNLMNVTHPLDPVSALNLYNIFPLKQFCELPEIFSVIMWRGDVNKQEMRAVLSCSGPDSSRIFGSSDHAPHAFLVYRYDHGHMYLRSSIHLGVRRDDGRSQDKEVLQRCIFYYSDGTRKGHLGKVPKAKSEFLGTHRWAIFSMPHMFEHLVTTTVPDHLDVAIIHHRSTPASRDSIFACLVDDAMTRYVAAKAAAGSVEMSAGSSMM